MTRKFTILALAIVGLHIVEATALGKSASGALLGNLLQIAASFIATYACFQAAKRSVRLEQAGRVDIGFVLDAAQIALIFLFIYVGAYYVPSLTLDAHGAMLREYAIAT